MKNDRFSNHDTETRNLVLDFEQSLRQGKIQFYDIDELEIIVDYYLDVADNASFAAAVDYAERLYPDSSEVKIWRAHYHLNNHDTPRALAILLDLHRREPDNTDVDYSLGEVYSEMGDPRKAIAHYLAAAADGWQLARIYSNIAEEYYNLNDYPNALRYYRRSLDLDPLDSTTLFNYTDTCAAATCPEEAATYLRQLLDTHPYCKEAWHCLGTIYAILGLTEKATDAFEYAIAIDPAFQPPYIELSNIYECNGQPTQAANMLHRLCDHSADPAPGLLLLGKLFLREENPTVALEYLHSALRLQPHNADALATLAMTEFQDGDLSQAELHAQAALESNPDQSDALFCLAMSHYAQGSTDEADAYFQRLIESPDCTEEHCHLYCHFLFDTASYNSLIDFAEESLSLYHHDDFYSAYLAAALFLTNRYKRLSQVLPDADPALLHKLCPRMWENPLVASILPKTE